MQCPRLDHFVRLNPSGKVSKCGHMNRPPEFDSLEQMEKSEWLEVTKTKMANNIWPKECIRCQKTEAVNKRSIRLDSIDRDKLLRPIDQNYFIVGGVLDNICNGGCQTCNSGLSTKIGSITGKPVKVNNIESFKKLPQDRILELDINGGEPTYSPNYKMILKDPPKNIKIVRINTNGHRPFLEIEPLLNRSIRVIVTVSFDGLYKIHDYVRWPMNFLQLEHTIKYYKNLNQEYRKLFRLNTWTTVSALNIGQLDEILDYTKENSLDHSFGILENPEVLAITKSNTLTQQAKSKYQNHDNRILKNLSKIIGTEETNSDHLKNFIKMQDGFRAISFSNYFNFDPNTL